MFGIRQGESGKSTILKNFQFHFAPVAFKEDSLAWRAVIHLNLVCIVNFILDLLPATSPTQPHGASGWPSRSDAEGSSSSRATTDEIRQLRMRLGPLREVEAILSKRLAMNKCANRRPSGTTVGSEQQQSPSPPPSQSTLKSAEFVVRSGSGWKARSKLHGAGGQDKLEEMRKIICACSPDIISLMANETVQGTILDHEEFQEYTTTL